MMRGLTVSSDSQNAQPKAVACLRADTEPATKHKTLYVTISCLTSLAKLMV